MRYRKISLILLLACWSAAPVAAYTIYLKDGSRILAQSEYTVDGDRAIIVLESGTETFLALSEIDEERTHEANAAGVGSALIFQDGQFVEKSESNLTVPERETVADLIARGEASMRGPARSGTVLDIGGSDAAAAPEESRRQPMRDIELAAALKEAFAARGFERAPIYQGTESGRAFVELTADSEASVFHGLEVAAEVLLAMQAEHAEDCGILELVLTTQKQERAGEFALTVDMARSIRDEQVELSSFFVRNVRF